MTQSCVEELSVTSRSGFVRLALPAGGGGAVEQHRALTFVAGERGGTLELGACLLVPAKPGEQIAADARQQVVAAELGPRRQRVDELKAPGRPERHGDRDRAVELHHRGRRE